MKSVKIFLFAFTAVLMLSCQTDELEPVKNPRFSVAFIQEIDASGAQFAANVYDFGNEEILEYGFVYAESVQPRIENAERVSTSGKPGQFFEIKASYSMQFGNKYYVAAYMKTASGYVYSATVEFESKGSEGFVFQRMEIPNPLYFNDTITVFGQNLSRIPKNYDVSVEGAPARVVEVNEGNFRFLLPEEFNFDDRIIYEQTLRFYFRVAGKDLEVSSPFYFRNPTFESTPIQHVNFDQEVYIEGDFLEGQDLRVYYKEEGYEYNLPVSFRSKNKFGFKPAARFLSQKPKIEVWIRGGRYELSETFSLNPSDFEQGQEFSIFGGDGITAKTVNKNIYNPYYNSLVSDVEGSYVQVYETGLDNPNEIFFSIGSDYNVVSRSNKVYFDNFGKKSTNYVTVSLLNPYLPVLRTPENFQSIAYMQGRGVSDGEKGYFFREKQVYRFDPNLQKLDVVAENTNNQVFNLANVFAMKAPNGKIYTGADNIIPPGGSLDFFEFDPATAKLAKLPNIPTKHAQPRAVYTTDQYLYYEGGFYMVEGFGYTESTERWRYSFAGKVWEKMADAITEESYIRRHVPFRYQGKLYLIGQEDGTFGNILFVFDEQSEQWSKVATLQPNYAVSTNEVFVIGDEAYMGYGNGLWKLDLKTFEETQFSFIDGSNLNFGLAPLVSVGMNNKFYFFNRYYNIVEFDPEFF